MRYPSEFLLVLLSFLGIVLGYLIRHLRGASRYFSKEDITAGFIPKAQHDYVLGHLQEATHRENVLQEKLRQQGEELAVERTRSLEWDKRMAEQAKEIMALQEKARIEFEKVSRALLEEKSQKFTHQNEENLHRLIAPLKEHISLFEENMQKRFLQETLDRSALKNEIGSLKTLNQQIAQDAVQLTNALKGNTKFQGDWGEAQLETLLQHAGLERKVHYLAQESLTGEAGNRQRPDFIVFLPDNKHLLIDAKVSLTAFERYHRVEDTRERDKALQEHLLSLRRHIRQLGERQYQQLENLESPDYVLLFVPVEPAFSLALQTDATLFQEALERNVVMVTTSTLLATLRTVSFIWKQEKQSRNVAEIARQSGLLIDKFVAFMEDIQDVADKLGKAQDSVQSAMNKLSQSPRKGDTLLGRARAISQLGARHSKPLPEVGHDEGIISPSE